jgi:hypothetical protein
LSRILSKYDYSYFHKNILIFIQITEAFNFNNKPFKIEKERNKMKIKIMKKEFHVKIYIIIFSQFKTHTLYILICILEL